MLDTRRFTSIILRKYFISSDTKHVSYYTLTLQTQYPPRTLLVFTQNTPSIHPEYSFAIANKDF